MGYALNELANLPLDANVHLYIFVVNGRYREPLYDMMQQNFVQIARDIGSNAVIAFGTEPTSFTTQVAVKYLGKGNSDNSFLDILPALIITDAHPENLTKESMRLVVPLKDAESRFGGWPQFFTLLASFARRESNEFVKRFEAKENLVDAANQVLSLRPGMFGISLNVNALIDRWNRKRA